MAGNKRGTRKASQPRRKANQPITKAKKVNTLEVLPVECVSRIVELLDVRRPNTNLPSKDLLALCRTSRAFNAIVTPLVYSHFDMGNEFRCRIARPFFRLSRFARTLTSSPGLAAHVKSMTLEWRLKANTVVSKGLKAIDDHRAKDPGFYFDLPSDALEIPLDCEHKLAFYFRYLVQRLIPCAKNMRSLDIQIMAPMPAVAKDAYWEIFDSVKPHKLAIPALEHVVYTQNEAAHPVIMWRFLHAIGRIAPGIKRLDLDVDMAENYHTDASNRSKTHSLSFPELTHLDIGQSLLHKKPDLERLLSSCPGLQSFSVDKFRPSQKLRDFTGNNCVVNILRQHSKGLKHLTIDLVREKPCCDEHCRGLEKDEKEPGNDKDKRIGCMSLEDSLKEFTELERLDFRGYRHMEPRVQSMAAGYWAQQQCHGPREGRILPDGVLNMVGQTEDGRFRWIMEM